MIEGISREEFTNELKEIVKSELAILLTEKKSQFLTRREVASKFRISIPSLDKLIHQGKLSASRINGRILIRVDDIEKALTEIPVRIKRKR